ncbi:MAG: EamA family transporter [Acidobacteriota bacterium]
MRKLLGYAAIYILWGGSFLAIREVVSVVPPFFAAGFRFTLAGLILILWSRFRGSFQLSGRQMMNASLLGLIMFACLYAPLFWAETRIPSGVAAVVSAMIPLWIYAGEVLFLRSQRATLLAFGGIGIGFAGVVLLTLRHRGHHAHARGYAIAIAVTVAGTLCWSAGTLLSRRLTLPSPQKLNAGWQMYTGGFILMIAGFVSGERQMLPELWVLASPRVLVSMAYLIVAASIVTYTAYVWLIAHESPTRVSSYAYVNPLIALLLGITLAGEHLTRRQVAGAALVILGVVATLMGKRPSRGQDEDPRPQRKISTVGLR